MKNQKSKNKLVLLLNKKTIVNLNSREMIHARSGEMAQAEGFIKVMETDPAVCQISITPVPTDFGITPPAHHPDKRQA